MKWGVAALIALGLLGVPATEAAEPPTATIHANFVSAESSTHYTLEVVGETAKPELQWELEIREIPGDGGKKDDSCTVVDTDLRGAGTPAETLEFIWHHGDQNGCDHNKEGLHGHQGRIHARATFPGWICDAFYEGSDRGNAFPNGPTFPCVSDGTTPPPPVDRCEKERIAVAVAKAKFVAAKEAALAAVAKAQEARAEAEAAKADYTRLLRLKSEFGFGALDAFGTATAAREAAQAAQQAADAASIVSARLVAEAPRAEEEFEDAKSDLEDCEKGLSLRIASPLVAAVPAACGGERAALAGAQARALVLGTSSKRLEATKMRPTESQLRKAIAGVAKMIADPRAKALAPKLKRPLARLRRVDAIFAPAVKRFDGLAKSAKAAARNVPKKQAALAKCRAGDG